MRTSFALGVCLAYAIFTGCPAEAASPLDDRLASAYEMAETLAAINPGLGAAARDQLAAGYASRAGDAAREASRGFSRGVGNRLTALHEAGPNGGVLAAAQSGSALAAVGGEDDFRAQEKVERFWIGGHGSWTSQNDKGGKYGYRYKSRGVIMGYDWERGDMTFGVSGGYAGGKLKNNEGYGRTDVDALSLGVYASYDPVCGFFADANFGIGYSWNTMHTDWILGGGTKKGTFDGSSYGGGFNAGYVFEWGDYRLMPTAGVQWTHVNHDGWTESGGTVANWFADGEEDYLELPLMVRLNRAFQLENGMIVTPEARVGWIHDAGDTGAELRTGYVGSGAPSVLSGVSHGRNRALLGAGVKANLTNRFDAFMDCNYEFRSGYSNKNLQTGVGVSF